MTSRRAGSLACGLTASLMAALFLFSAQAASQQPRAAPARASVLGIYWPTGTGRLALLNPVTLRRDRGSSLPLAGHDALWSYSPDRSRLVLAGWQLRTLRFVEVRGMRLLGDLRLPQTSGVRSLAWVSPTRLLVTLASQDATSLRTIVLLVDTQSRRVLRRLEIARPSWETVRTRSGLLILLGSFGHYAATELARVDAEGQLRRVKLVEIPIGTVVTSKTDHTMRTRRPGLAVDAAAGRAYVIDAGGTVGEVNLRTMRVSYRTLDLAQQRSRRATPRRLVKATEGPERYARWLGDGLIALSGIDSFSQRDASGELSFSQRAAGLQVIDSRSWTATMIEPRASGFDYGDGVLFGLGGSWESKTNTRDVVGIAAFDPNGSERYRLFADKEVSMYAAGDLGYVYRGDLPAFVIELASGERLAAIPRKRGRPLPVPLVTQSGG
ncbi:MAG: hypothetical protein ABR521_01050 [Gaiellaceae bacterium]